MKEDNTFWELNRNWKKLQEQIEQPELDDAPDEIPDEDEIEEPVTPQVTPQVTPEVTPQVEPEKIDKSLKTCGSIFSGIGGWEYGAKQVGLKPIFAFEFNKNYADAYKKSHGDHVTVGDIQQTHTSLQHSAVDVLFASPPCQNFSGAKHRTTKTVISQDAKTDVGIYVVKVVEKANPKVIFIENVIAYLNHPDSPLKDIVSQLSEKYHVHTMIIDAHEYGCPTSRKRMLATFVRKDLFDGPFVPKPTNKVEEAKSWFSVVGDLISTLKPGKVSPWQQKRIDRWADFYPDPDPKAMKYPLQISGNNVSATAFNAGKPVKVMRSVNEPSFTIVKSYQAMEQTRIILEDGTCLVANPHCFARWQGFPDEVFANLPEDPKTATEMIGNAVPPQLCISVLQQLKNL